ncbi:MAG TPA: serine/threonine-protein kinase [Gemmataceae bacterium]|nr:serine/threonine-protein kinase [Gemmataceae bacterium]
MAKVDAATLGQQAVRLGLVTVAQLEECRDELGPESGDVEALLAALERKEYLTPLQSEKLLKGDEVGYFYGGYRLRFKIGAGSFGRIYRADNPHTGEIVAVKVLRRRWTDNPHNVELFMREGRLGMTLRHPNIVSILAVNKDAPSGQHYIVMEFVEGANLRDFLRKNRKKLEPKEALRLLEDTVAGLAHAYSHGFTHRDMKLTNILISTNGTAKLVDFGLAGFTAPQGFGREDDEQVDRTVDYAGLEKTTGVKPGDVRSDIFFLGCVLYEILTGRPPIDMSRDKHARMHKQRFEKIPPIQPDELSGPPAVFRVVETMMSVDPKQRYQTPSQLLQAVRAARRDLEGGGGPEENARPAERSVFVVEGNVRLQGAIREKFKEAGYRVFIAANASVALERFRQQPFDALVVDLGTAGEEGLDVFHKVIGEAKRQQLTCAAILLLEKDQADWVSKVKPHKKVAVMVRPVTLKDLHQKLCELVPPAPAVEKPATPPAAPSGP